MSHSHTYPDLPSTVMKDDGTKGFSAPVSGQTPLNAAHLATKDYVDSQAGGNATSLRGILLDVTAPSDEEVYVYDAGEGKWVLTSISELTGQGGRYPLPINSAVTHDDATAASSAFTVGTAEPPTQVAQYLQAAMAGAGTEWASIWLDCARLPANFIPGTPVVVRLRLVMSAGALVPDVTKNLDLFAYAQQGDGDTPSDICATAAQDVDAQLSADVYTDYDFVITSTNLHPGDDLALKVRINGEHSASPLDWTLLITKMWLIIDDYDEWIIGRDLVGSAKVG